MALLWHEGPESGDFWTAEHCTKNAPHCPNNNIFAALRTLLLAQLARLIRICLWRYK